VCVLFYILFSKKLLFLVKLIQTESHELKLNSTQSTVKEWWIERQDSSSTILEDNESETSNEFCIPFYTCPTNLNRSILTIVVPIFLLICCFYYHCYEYCKVKHDLEQLHQYRHIDA